MGRAKTNIKEQLYQECKKILKSTIDLAQEAVTEAQQDAQEYQSNDALDGYKSQTLHRRDIFAEQLKNSMEDFNILERLDISIKHKIVEFGSLVITDKQKIFIAIGLGKISFLNEDYFVILPKVPIFNILKGLKPGDTFTFNGKKGTIKEII